MRVSADNDIPTMKQNSICRRFNRLDFHDDNLLSITILPPRTKTNKAVLKLALRDYATGKTKTLSFRGCGNLRITMDFDVLADNWFAQTDQTRCDASPNRMRRYVRAQAAHWRVRYMPPTPKNKPVRKKLSQIERYQLFTIAFFGGYGRGQAKRFDVKAGSAAVIPRTIAT